MKRNKRALLLAAWNFAVFAAVLISWFFMLFFGTGERFSEVGFRSLRYYTVLSNFFEAFASLGLGAALLGGGRRLAFWQYAKLAAAGTVAVTFLVAMLFLAPVVYGYPLMLRGANLIFHLIVPLAAIAEYPLFDRFTLIPFRRLPLCLAPTLLYGAVYTALVLTGKTEDFYAFVTWGVGPGCLIFAAILLTQFSVLTMMNALNRVRKKRISVQTGR